MQGIISYNLSELRRYFRICPAVFVLLEYMAGIWSVLFSGGVYGIALGCLLGVAVCWRRVHLWLLPMALGAGMAFLHERSPWDSYAKHLPRSECSAIIHGYMGSHCGNERFRWKCEFKLREVSFYDGNFKPCGGKVLAYFPDDVPYQYGAECTLEGSFLEFEDDFSRRYNRTRGLRRTFHADIVRDFTPAKSRVRRAFAWLTELRQLLCERLVGHIDGAEESAIYSAMIFGMRDGLPRNVRDSFVKSATVHLFSISGLHIGLMSICLGFVARLLCVPLRWRLPLVCLLLLVYVLLSGGAPSALRAWLMILLVIVSQSRWHIHSSENTLGAAGLALLLMNPLYLLHTGFVFSFILVYVLLRSEGICRSCIEILCEKRQWLPRGSLRSLVLGAWGRILGTVLGGCAAWLGCNGVMMLWNGLVSYGSIAVNALVGPVALVLVAGAMPKIALSFLWEGGDRAMGACLGWLLKMLLFASEAASSQGLYRTGARIPIVVCLCYYVLLWLALSSMRPHFIRVCCLLGLLAVTAGFYWQGQRRKFVLACASEKGGNACIAYADRPHHALILQAGEWNAARKVLRELESLGHVDEMDLMVSATGDLAAAKALMKGRQGRIFAGGKMNRRKEEFLQFALYSGWNIHDEAPELPVEIRNGQPGMENIVFNGRECLVECSLRPSVKRLE